MDLYAYSQIEKLDDLAKKNGIVVPRLRGYRLMSEEEAMSEEALESLIEEHGENSRDTFETFNKYSGRFDVLYIHARIGGGNWLSCRNQVKNQPWFLEKVDDFYDNTYCDIYAKIDATTLEEDK